MRLILVRHGETAWNRDRRYQGQNNVELNDTGLEQARLLAGAPMPARPAALYSSPLRRALQTAEFISRARGLPVNVVDGLKELDLGEVEGLTGARMMNSHPEVIRAWRKDPASLRMPGGESLAELQDRAWAAVEEMTAAHTDGEAVMAVSHNFAIGALVCRALGLPLSRFHRIRVDLGSVTTLERGPGGWRVAALNETQHLRPAG